MRERGDHFPGRDGRLKTIDPKSCRILRQIKKLNRRGRRARRGNNGQMPCARMQVQKRPSFPPFPEGQNSQGTFQERSLRSLPPLRSSSCLHPRRIERQRGVHIDKMNCVFCLYQEKALRSLRTLRFIFSSSSEGAQKGNFLSFLGQKPKPL